MTNSNRMKVYAVLNCFEYEGDILMAIFSTRELAEKFELKVRRNGSPERIEIREIELDAES